MRLRNLAGWFTGICLFLASLSLAADYSGTYGAPDMTLKLAAHQGGYTGTIVIKTKPYPVTAGETGGALVGSFVEDGQPVGFTAELKGDTLTIRSGPKTIEFKREREANPPAPAVAATQRVTQPAQARADAAATAAMLRNMGPVQTDPRREWLIAVYMDGDNSLEPSALVNLEQMASALPEGVEVIVLFDRPIDRAEHTAPRLLRMRKNQEPEVLREFAAPIDMGDSQVLSGFIEGALKTFPAPQHILDVWDHGGGWASLANDDHASEKEGDVDKLTMPRFRKALLEGAKAAGLKKWDMILFDMCLMGQLEVAAQIHDLTDIMVASEEQVPGLGLPYTAVLGALGKGTLGVRKIAANIVTEFDKFHNAENERDTTLAALDMSQFELVNSRLNALCDKLIPAMPRAWSALARGIFYGEQYNLTREDYRDKEAWQSVDLMDVLKKCRAAMAGNFPAEAEYRDLKEAMDRFVIVNANSEHRRMSNGVAIYAPVLKEAYDPDYDALVFAGVSHWPRLLQALYPEQKKNEAPPRFGKFEVLDSSGAPAAAILPLSGFNTAFEVEGKNLIWVHDRLGIGDPQAGGVRILSNSYVIDPDFLKNVVEGKRLGQDIDAIMPQMTDGMNRLRQPQLGVMFRLSNGDKSIQAMIDNSDLANPTTFFIPAKIQDSKLAGPGPFEGKLYCNGITMVVTAIVVIEKMPDGSMVEREFEPTEQTVVTPVFDLFKDDGTVSRCSKESIAWKKGLYFTMGRIPAGDCEEILTAETMTGVSTTARFHFQAADDPQLAQAKQSWQNFKADAMVGTWEWFTAAGQPTGYSMEIETSESASRFLINFILKAPDGKTVVYESRGALEIDLQDQPFYHIMTDYHKRSDGRMDKPKAVMLGTAIWAPTDTESRIIARDVLLKQEITWIKKGGSGGGGLPKHKAPDGWVTFTNAAKTFSIDMPPNFKEFPLAIRNGKKLFDGFEFAANDPQAGAYFEVIRLDGVDDPDKAAQIIIGAAARVGARMEVGPKVASKIAGTDSFTYSGREAANGRLFGLGINLIPIHNGFVVVNVTCIQQNVQFMLPTLVQIVDSVQVAKHP